MSAKRRQQAGAPAGQAKLEKREVTVRELRESHKAIVVVGNMKWPRPEQRTHFARLIMQVNREAEASGPIIDEILSKHAEEVGDDGRVSFKDIEARRAYEAEVKPILDQVVALEFVPLPPEDFPADAPPAALAALWWAIRA